MTTDNRAFRITIFPDRWARTMRAIQVSEPGLIVPTLVELINSTTAPTKERLPLLKLASFGPTKSAQGCFRHDANVKLVYGVEIDHDGEAVAFGDAVRRMRDAAVVGVLYTSPRHRPEAPRWRALCPFSGAMLPAGRRCMARRAGAVLGIDLGPDSLTLSQSYYFGRVGNGEHFRIEITDGLRRAYGLRQRGADLCRPKYTECAEGRAGDHSQPRVLHHRPGRRRRSRSRQAGAGIAGTRGRRHPEPRTGTPVAGG